MPGAGAGAIIGHQTGDAGEGALIGAAFGAVTGAILGEPTQKTSYTTREVIYVTQPPTRTVVTQRQTVRRAGHYETRLVRGPSGETYEERIWVYDN